MKIVLQSTNDKVIGHHPQANLDSSTLMNGAVILPSDVLGKRPPEGSILPDFLLHARAKFTDYLSAPAITGPKQMMISKKLANLFRSYQGLSFDTIPVDVKKDDLVQKYEFLNYYDSLPIDVIDFKHSQFKQYDYDKHTYSPIRVDSAAAFLQAKNIKLTNLSLVPELTGNLHHFYIPSTTIWLISDELAVAMKAHSITGLKLYDFTPETDLSRNNLRKLKPYL